MIIRPFEQADLKSLAALHAASKQEAERGIIYDDDLAIFTPAFYEEKWAEWSQYEVSRLRLAFCDGGDGQDLLGFVSYGSIRTRPDFDKGVVPRFGGEIYALYVHLDTFGQGVGTALFLHACRDLVDMKLTSMLLWAMKKNKRACGFYEAMGGERVAKKRIEIGQKSWAEESCFAWRDIRKITAG